MKIEITFWDNSFANLNPSEYNNVSAINSLSGTLIATGLNSYFKLSGNLLRPPYPFPAGLRVTKIAEFLLTSTVYPISYIVYSDSLIAHWMIWIYYEIAESCSSSNLLNSSKHPQAPHFTNPMKILPILLKSKPSSQLNTKTYLPNA